MSGGRLSGMNETQLARLRLWDLQVQAVARLKDWTDVSLSVLLNVSVAQVQTLRRVASLRHV